MSTILFTNANKHKIHSCGLRRCTRNFPEPIDTIKRKRKEKAGWLIELNPTMQPKASPHCPGETLYAQNTHFVLLNRKVPVFHI